MKIKEKLKQITIPLIQCVAGLVIVLFLFPPKILQIPYVSSRTREYRKFGEKYDYIVYYKVDIYITNPFLFSECVHFKGIKFNESEREETYDFIDKEIEKYEAIAKEMIKTR